MDSSNITSVIQRDYIKSILAVEELLETYINRVICGIGIILNLFFLCVLYKPKIIYKISSYLWCRTFCNLIVCILGVAFTDYYHEEKRIGSLAFFEHEVFIIATLIRIAFMASILSDILVILNKFLMLLNMKSFWADLNKIMNLVICYGIGITLFVPLYFVNDNGGGYDSWKSNVLGSIYLIVLLFLECVIPVLVLTILNLTSVYKFRKIMRMRGHLISYKTKERKIEIRTTKIVILLTLVCIITRAFDMFCEARIRIGWFKLVEYSAEEKVENELISHISKLFMNCAHAFEGIVYFTMDKNLKNMFLDHLNVKR
ncbi:MAG: hypothetical protein ACI93N_001838 [Flavobacteriaceae bacterium]|jgi:hypothetical protein